MDAMMYQCPNQQWKEKIMEGKFNFQEVVEYGMTKLTAKEEGKAIGTAGVKTDSPDLPVDKLDEDKDKKKEKLIDCNRCFEKHAFRNCPAWGYQCSRCQMYNHLAGSKQCREWSGPSQGADQRSGRGQRGQRGQRARGDGRGRGRYNNQGGTPTLHMTEVK